MTPRSARAVAEQPFADLGRVQPEVVVGVAEDGMLLLQEPLPSEGVARASLEPRRAQMTRIPGYRPTPGDKVLVAITESGRYVIAVLTASEPESLRLADGTIAELREGGIELRDSEGRLLVRYSDGCAEIQAPTRDLKLSAPKGRVLLEAGLDVAIEAGRDLSQRVGRRLACEVRDTEQVFEIGPKRAHLRVRSSTSRLARVVWPRRRPRYRRQHRHDG